MFFGYPGRAIPEQWQIHVAESTGEAFDFITKISPPSASVRVNRIFVKEGL
jgi:hypothetical protein